MQYVNVVSRCQKKLYAIPVMVDFHSRDTLRFLTNRAAVLAAHFGYL